MRERERLPRGSKTGKGTSLGENQGTNKPLYLRCNIPDWEPGPSAWTSSIRVDKVLF